MALPRVDQTGVAYSHGHSRFPLGVMENGEYFVTTLFQVAQQLVLMGDSEGVKMVHPLSSEVSFIQRSPFAVMILILIECLGSVGLG